jgi:hypothetical protein
MSPRRSFLDLVRLHLVHPETQQQMVRSTDVERGERVVAVGDHVDFVGRGLLP